MPGGRESSPMNRIVLWHGSAAEAAVRFRTTSPPDSGVNPSNKPSSVFLFRLQNAVFGIQDVLGGFVDNGPGLGFVQGCLDPRAVGKGAMDGTSARDLQ